MKNETFHLWLVFVFVTFILLAVEIKKNNFFSQKLIIYFKYHYKERQ